MWMNAALPASTPPRIWASKVTRVYGRGGESVRALDGVSLALPPGAFAAITGPSGCGKTTLLHLLAGIDRPDSGDIWLDGERLNTRSESQLAVLRRQRIGLVFQSFNLLTNMTALENVMLPALLIGTPTGQARRQAEQLLDWLGLRGHMRRLPADLSGGQQQRVAFARAIVNSPSVLLADEPTGNLDTQSGREVMRLLTTLHARGLTVVLVTHDPTVAAQAERMLIMRDGRIVDEAQGQRAGPVMPPLADVSTLELE
jgi:putative ABC transport system ATP-binding protein